MSFSLFNFWIPLILIIQTYYFLPSRKWRNLYLLTVSWGFYLLIDWRVFPCLLISTATDYIAGFFVVPERKKSIRLTGLFGSLFINLGLLFTFKYFPEIFHTNNDFTSLLRSIGLPLGISFYTFQTIGYTIDCYRGQIKPTSNFLAFALYVSFFPQIAAGPIEQAKRLLPQFQSSIIKNNLQKFKEGFYLILLGLFKKIYVAGALIHPLQRIYETNDPPPSLALLSGSLAIFHVYADFSAYSDLARGIAKFFGIELMVNFRPFIFSKNPREFWKNWHISLYEWIKNYFIKFNLRKRYADKLLYLLIVFLTFALWHRASLNWMLFGIFNALCFYGYSLFSVKKLWQSTPSLLKYIITIILMFFFHSINGLLYYSNDFGTVLTMAGQIIKFNGSGRETFDLLFYLFPFMFSLFIYEWFQNKHGTELFIMKSPFLIRAFWIALVIVCIFIFERNTEHSFIYFGF